MTNLRVLPRTLFGNPILRKRAIRVSRARIQSAELQELIRLMFYTMRQANGVGLAAPQVGESLQLAVIAVKKNPVRPNVVPVRKTVIINPRIIGFSEALISDWEGCLSLPGVRGLVPRSRVVTVEYTDDKGKRQTTQYSGFAARVFQHEIDHLNGTVYVDRMPDMKSLMTVSEFRERVVKKGLKSI